MLTELENKFIDVEAVKIGVRGWLGLCVFFGRIVPHGLDRTPTRLGMGESARDLDFGRIRRVGEILPVHARRRG
ncbi:MAG: hypothetical protein ABSC42_10875 [Tepidisphaeraceae bacterium]|jgi:hypothetical protein